MGDVTPRCSGLDPERFAQVDAKLRRAEAYFTRLRDELRDSYTAINAEAVVKAIQRLRDELQRDQRYQDIGRRISGHNEGAASS